ncbi:MAG TPA: MFS transporter [Candidatus Polarisedimenticolaceae bacterium]|nr:MFS transporter [Candidatus Polarisedimenticolaceae bacterium]
MSPGDPGPTLYPDPATRRRAIAGWCLFDFANSAYTTLIPTVAFSVFFVDVVVHAADRRGDQLWGWANTLAMALAAVTSPWLGALADYSGRKKRMLMLVSLQTVAATALLATVGPGTVTRGMLLYVLATLGFEWGYVFYNAFLPEISTPRTIGRISGWAWAVGYVGGLACLLLCYPWITSELRAADGTLVAAAVGDRQLSFVLVAAFFLVFALPAFLWLREQPAAGRSRDYARVAVRRVLDTLAHLRAHRQAAKYVVASMCFNDGISTIISFSAIYATGTFGFGSGEVAQLFLVLNIVAFPGAAAAGYLADAIGSKRTLLLSLVLWLAVVVTGAAAHSRGAFWLMACGAAIGMGSTQAVGRSFMAQLSPPARESEFFGFYVLSGKFGSIFGPLLYGTISRASGSQRLAVLSLLPLFLAGLLLVWRVDDRQS